MSYFEGKKASRPCFPKDPEAAQPPLLGRQRVRLEAFKAWDSKVMREKRRRKKKQQMAACARRSQYQGRAALQTSVTDLMDEVSHTHLQYENDHLHQTHMGRAQWVAFIKHCFSGFPGHPLFVRVLCSTLALCICFQCCAPVFSLEPLLTGYRSGTPALSGNHNQS